LTSMEIMTNALSEIENQVELRFAISISSCSEYILLFQNLLQ